MNATGDADLENWYNYLERIQKRMVKKNLRYLLSVIFQAGVRTGEVDEVPKIKVEFNPLWSLSDTEQADLDQKRAQTQFTRAQTAQLYIDKQVIDPSEVRAKLADSEEFDVENMLDEYDDEDLFPDEPAEGGQVSGDVGQSIFEQGQFADYAEGTSTEEHKKDPGGDGEAPAAAPAATKLPQDMSDEERQQSAANAPQNRAKASVQGVKGDGNTSTPEDTKACVGVLVVSQGKVLSGTRKTEFGHGLICGPGGHIKAGESPKQAAFREAEEEFGISPKELIPLGRGPMEPDTGIQPYIFLCTEYEGEPNCVDGEMADPQFRTLEEIELLTPSLFQPFADGVEVLKAIINSPDDPDPTDPDHDDGGPGSGNHGHEGVPGQVGGSAPSGDAKMSKDSFQKGKGDFELTGDVTDLYLTETARARVEGLVKTVKTASDLENYLKDQGIKLETSYEPLRNAMGKEIRSVKEQADYVIAAVEQYKDLGGLTALKAVHIYEPDLDAQAQYSYRAKGEEDVPDEGHLYISDRATGKQVMHEFAHAFADSTKPEGFDVVEWSAKLNKEAGLPDRAGTYLGANADVREAERFADAMGGALTYGEGTDNRLSFAANVANIVNGVQSKCDGGPGSGNHGHEGVPGQVGGSAPSLTPAASKLLHGKSEDFKAEFLVEKGMRFREVDKAIQAGKLDELVDEKLREVAKERKRVADKAPDDSKVRKSAEKASLEIRNNADETLVSYDEDGNEIARDTGSAHGVKSGQNNAAYSTLHNHPGDTDSCFSDTDVRSFANADEQVMYMTSKTKLYSLQKTSDYDGYSARSVATHLESLEKKYQDGDMTRNDLIAETDLYLQLHAHEYGLVYKQQEVDGK